MLDAPRRFSATSAAINNGQKALQTVKPKDQLPEFISKILFYPIQGIIPEASTHKRTYGTSTYGLVGGLLTLDKLPQDPPMPQEVSVSYQAVKSKVYRLIDALVVGEKSEADVQESIRRWWELIHPADRPIAQKYLALVLERSTMALDAIEEGRVEATQQEMLQPAESSKALKIVGRVSKQAALTTTAI